MPTSTTTRRASKKATKKKVAKKKVSRKVSLDDAFNLSNGQPKPKANAKRASKPKASDNDVLSHVMAVRCTSCFALVYSRCQGDQRACHCRTVSASGGPTDIIVNAGALGARVTTLALEVPVTRGQLRQDWQTQKGHFGLVRFPTSAFRCLLNALFPVRFHDGMGRFHGELAIANPRSLPERAAFETSSCPGRGPLWISNNEVWGKIAYRIHDRRSPGPVHESASMTKIIPVPLLAQLTSYNPFVDFGRGWQDALKIYASRTPDWTEKPARVRDLMFFDVMALKGTKTQSGYRKRLLAKSRIGKLIVESKTGE